MGTFSSGGKNNGMNGFNKNNGILMPHNQI